MSTYYYLSEVYNATNPEYRVYRNNSGTVDDYVGYAIKSNPKYGWKLVWVEGFSIVENRPEYGGYENEQEALAFANEHF